MFNPCSDQEYQGKRISCVRNIFFNCRDCEFARLKRENDQLKDRIRKELEPRLKVERQCYDRRVIDGGTQ